MRFRTLLLVSLVALPLPSSAQAQPPDKASADALFRAAREEFDRGSFASACEKFAESNRLDPAPGTVLNLSVCLEKTGRVASAWEGYRQVAEQLRDERVAFATSRSQELEARLPWLTLRLAPTTPQQARLFRDGVELRRPSLGIALPVDPGMHTVTVKLAGHDDASVSVTMAEGDHKEVEVAPGKPKDAPPRATAPGATQESAGPHPLSSAPNHPWAWVAGGIGLAGVATSIVTGALALSSKQTLGEHCVEQRCDADGLSAADRGRTYARVSTVAGIVGVAGIGVSTWLFVTTGKEQTSDTRLDAAVLPGGVGVTMGRRF